MEICKKKILLTVRVLVAEKRKLLCVVVASFEGVIREVCEK